VQPTETDPVVEQLYKIAKNWTGSTPTPATVVPFTISLMTAVQSIVTERGRGPYKKTVVLTVLRLIVENETSMAEDDRAALMLALNTTVPAAIDVAVGIASGEINLEKHAARASRLWKACFPCCF